jgi:hypothetical protein
LTLKKNLPWTKQDDALVCRLRRRNFDYDEIAEQLPHRTVIAVRRRVAHLITTGRIPSRRAAWTANEDALISKLRAGNKSAAAIATQLPGRTAAAVARRIRQLRFEGRVGDIRKPPANRSPWTDRDEGVVIQMRARHATLDEIAAKLPHRSRGAVAVKINELIEVGEIERAAYSPLSYRPWSREEDQLVTGMRQAGSTLDEMAKALDRTVASVSSRIVQRVRRGDLDAAERVSGRERTLPAGDEK